MRRLVSYLFLFLTLSSCSIETRLAKRFIQQSENADIAVYFPETALLTDARHIDSVYTAPLIDSLNADLFLDVMYNAYSEELQKYKLNIYYPDDPDDIQVDSLHWLALLTKVDIQESTVEYMDYGYGPRDYRYYYPLKCINVASWFDFNSGEWSNTQFHELNLTDGFSSEASYRHGVFNYTHQIDTLHIDKVYNFAVFLGKLYASYTYDYFMNRYIADELLKKNMKNSTLLHYDLEKKELYYRNEGEGFYDLPGEEPNLYQQQNQQQ